MRQTCCALALVTAAWVAPAHAQLRIASMNTTNFDLSRSGPQPGMDLILQAIANTVSDDPLLPGNTGIVKRPDVLAIQEALSWQTTGVQYQQLLAQLFPGSNYVVAPRNGASNGAGTQILIYDADALQLIAHTAVGTTSGSGMPRQVTRYQLRPAGYGSNADFYIYNLHTKAGPEQVNIDRRGVEAAILRANADSLPLNSNIIYLGDFNTYTAAEPFIQTMIAPGRHPAMDPINQLGTPENPAHWNHNIAYKPIHTQSPFNQATANALGTGFSGAAGGMDDRLDFQLMTANLLDGRGVAYIPNSYQAFGNNNTHQYNQPIDYAVGGNIVNQAQPAAVLRAMASIMDHVPVVADYQLPARMTVNAAPAPTRMIRGADVSIDISVANTAPVIYAIGADRLEYTLTTTGSLSGSASGNKPALEAATLHAVSLSTAATGVKSGSWNVLSTSQQVAGPTAGQSYNYTVVDPSNASFNPAADLNNRTIDFGYVPQNFASRTAPFQIANLQAPSGLTASLRLTAIDPSGSTAMTTSVSTFNGMVAGAIFNYTATLNTASPGPLTTTHTYAVADEAIPGATAGTPLVLTMTARILSSATFPATGAIHLLAGETYDTGPFSIAAGVTLTKTGPGTMHISAPQSNAPGSTLHVTGGTVRLSTDADGLALAATASTLLFDAPQRLSSLTVGSGATVTLMAGANTTLESGALSITGGTLDLTDNDAIITVSADLVRQYLLTGRAGGNWNGPGIISSSAAADPTHATAIGYAPAALLGLAFDTPGDHPPPVVLKYTSYGDANLDGRLNADDFALIDRGMAQSLAGWVFGDFDYSGAIDAADYLLLDMAFGRQLGTLSSSLLAERTARFGDGYVSQLVAAVPEPAVIPLAIAPLLLSMRRRSKVRR